MIIWYSGREIQEKMLIMAVTSGRWHPGGQEITDLLGLFAVGQLVRSFGPINRNHDFVFNFDCSPLPPNNDIDLEFGEVCDSVAHDIWQRAQNRNVALWWSGGIDSTTALVALMRTNPRWSQQLKIYTSRYATEVEYPWFYQRYLSLSDHQVLHGYDLWSPKLFDTNYFLLDGNCGDQLWGSMVLADLSVDYSDHWRSLFDLEYFQGHVRPGYRQCVTEYISDQVAKFPVPINTIADVFWFMNFTHKWDYIKHKAAIRSGQPDLINRICCFYDNWDFQRWSMCNPQHRSYSQWKQYKQPAKDYICEYTGDRDYQLNKVKSASPPLSFEYDSVPLKRPDEEMELVSLINDQISDEIPLYLRD